MLAFDTLKVGQHYFTQQQTAVGGYFVLFISFSGIAIGYYSLSPFNKIREFLEGTGRKRK